MSRHSQGESDESLYNVCSNLITKWEFGIDNNTCYCTL